VSRFCPVEPDLGFDDGAQRLGLEEVRARATCSCRMLLYENKKIDTNEPDETDGDGDGNELEI
jgi:hypothetical protein